MLLDRRDPVPGARAGRGQAGGGRVPPRGEGGRRRQGEGTPRPQRAQRTQRPCRPREALALQLAEPVARPAAAQASATAGPRT